MAARKRPASERVRTAGSWMALLAATTLGSEVAAESVRAEVRADASLPGDTYRLIVQSYDATTAALRDGRAKPVGSMQRFVSAEELRAGIRVDFVELRDAHVTSGEGSGARGDEARPLVVAWLEGSDAAGDYDVDARDARPAKESVFGSAHRSSGDVKIRLRRRA